MHRELAKFFPSAIARILRTQRSDWICLPRGDWDGHQKVGSGNDSKGYIEIIIYEGPIHIEDEQNRSVAVCFPVNHLLLISLLRDR